MPLPLSPRHRLRPGGSWTRQAGDDPHALVTLVAFDRDEEPDERGRRPSDVNVGSVKSADLAESFCVWYNGAQGRYQESLTGVPTRSDDGPVPRQPDEEAPVAPYTYQPTVRDVTSLPTTVDRTLLAALLETSPCQAARESYNGHVSSGEETRASAHPLAREYACPSCDLARALGVPERFAVEGPPSEPGVGDQVVYIGPVGDDSRRRSERREVPGIIVRVGDSSSPVTEVPWQARVLGETVLAVVWHLATQDTYTAPLDELRVVERASYIRVYEH